MQWRWRQWHRRQADRLCVAVINQRAYRFLRILFADLCSLTLRYKILIYASFAR